MKIVDIYIREIGSNKKILVVTHRIKCNDQEDLDFQTGNLIEAVKDDLVNKRFKEIFVPIKDIHNIEFTHEVR